MKIKGMLMKKVHIINIVISIVLAIFAIVCMVFAGINTKSVLLPVFGVINAIWLIAQVVITFTSHSGIKNKWFPLTLFTLTFIFNLNIFFIYYGIFEKYVIYSSIIAIIILIIFSSYHNNLDDTKIEIHDVATFLFGTVLFVSLVAFACALINSIDLLRHPNKNPRKKQSNLAQHTKINK